MGGKAITDRATLAAWLLRCGTLVRRSLRPSGPSWRGIVGLERLIPCLQTQGAKLSRPPAARASRQGLGIIQKPNAVCIYLTTT
jgi:hypothetical protein